MTVYGYTIAVLVSLHLLSGLCSGSSESQNWECSKLSADSFAQIHSLGGDVEAIRTLCVQILGVSYSGDMDQPGCSHCICCQEVTTAKPETTVTTTTTKISSTSLSTTSTSPTTAPPTSTASTSPTPDTVTSLTTTTTTTTEETTLLYTDSTSMSTTTEAPPIICLCSCEKEAEIQQQRKYYNLNETERKLAIQRNINEIKRNLSVSAPTLSKARRQLISAPNNKVSADVVGFVIVITTIFLVVGGSLLSDIPLLVKDSSSMCRRFKTLLNRNRVQTL